MGPSSKKLNGDKIWFKTSNLSAQPGRIQSYLGEGWYQVLNTDKNTIHIVFMLDLK